MSSRHISMLDTSDLAKELTAFEEDTAALAEELEEAREEYAFAVFNGDPEEIVDAKLNGVHNADGALRAAEDSPECAELKALACAMGAVAWQERGPLIADGSWVEYVQELVSGDVPGSLPDYVEIDWDATARNLAVDYYTVDFRGITYYYRKA